MYNLKNINFYLLLVLEIPFLTDIFTQNDSLLKNKNGEKSLKTSPQEIFFLLRCP